MMETEVAMAVATAVVLVATEVVTAVEAEMEKGVARCRPMKPLRQLVGAAKRREQVSTKLGRDSLSKSRTKLASSHGSARKADMLGWARVRARWERVSKAQVASLSER